MSNTHRYDRNIRRCALVCALLFAFLPQSISENGTGSSSLSSDLLPSAVMQVNAATVTEDSIKEKEAQIEEAKKQQEEVQNSISDLQAMKAELETKKSNLTEYVTQLDAQMTEIQKNIDSLNEQISQKESEIADTQDELEAAQKVQDQQYEAMKARCRFLYETGDKHTLEVLLKSTSFGDMLNKAYYIEQLSAYDTKLLEQYRQQTELVKTTQEALEEEKKTLDEQQSAVKEEESNLQALIDEKKEEIASTEADIAESAASIDQYEAQLEEQNSTISSLEASVAEDKKTLEAQKAAAQFQGGTFTFPCPSYSYISSEFGYRVHPIYGTTIFHSGLDIAANYGASIVAAANGTVVAASYEPSMGNYIMINHGGGLYTIYMHCSALYVSAGQTVSAGQQIAAVGSTGNSTGPHLHFSVRLNGQYVNPRNYLGG